MSGSQEQDGWGASPFIWGEGRATRGGAQGPLPLLHAGLTPVVLGGFGVRTLIGIMQGKHPYPAVLELRLGHALYADETRGLLILICKSHLPGHALM